MIDERDRPMEEILASIRDIIAEEDGQARARKAPAQPAQKARVAPPVVLELTDIVVAPEESLAPAFPLPEAPKAKKKAPAAAPHRGPDPLLSPSAQESATAAFASLVQATQSQTQAYTPEGGGLRVDELVADAVKPLLKVWLDTHLPGIVERAVAVEIRKLTDKFRL